MGYNFVAVEREQLMLMPPSVADWLREDHLAWFVLDVVAELDLTGFLGLAELTGLDLVDDLGAVLLSLSDLGELAGPTGCDEGLHPAEVEVVLAPVASIGHDSPDPAALAWQRCSTGPPVPTAQRKTARKHRTT
jgi:hypothetical protein